MEQAPSGRTGCPKAVVPEGLLALPLTAARRCLVVQEWVPRFDAELDRRV